MPASSRAALLTLAVATQFSPVASANERLRHNTRRWDFYAIPAKMDFCAIPCEAACYVLCRHCMAQGQLKNSDKRIILLL